MNALCFSVALANTRAFDDNAGCPRPILVPRVDKVVVDKTRRRLTLMGRQHVVRSYRISLGEDGRTPAGRYVVAGRNPHSPNHLALRHLATLPVTAMTANSAPMTAMTATWMTVTAMTANFVPVTAVTAT